MTIVQINAVYNFSSTGRTTEELHKYCVANGHASYVFCANWDDEPNNIFRIGSKLSQKIHAVLSRITGRQACFSFFATKLIIRRLKRINPDVVILRNLHGNYIHLPIFLQYLAANNIPTIAVQHDCWLFTGHCTHYTYSKCFKWKNECYSCSLMRQDNRSLFFDTSKTMFHMKHKYLKAIPRLGIVGVSEWITSEASRSKILKHARYFRSIYNWIDKEKFYPRQISGLRSRLGIGNDFVVLGVSQSWSERKGLSHFIKLAKSRPTIKVILIGALPSIENLPLNIINTAPTQSIDELAEFYSLADVLLVCSVQETFGKVSAEALACGTPVIANNATANPEIVGLECGISVENNNDDEILRAVDYIKQKGKAYYAEKCVERARRLFDKDTQAEKYLQAARDLISISE